MKLQGQRIAFLGDSITEGHGVDAPVHFFMNIMKEREGLAEAWNFGIGGTRIARQRGVSDNPVFDRYFRSRVAELPAELDGVVVFGGTNDFGHGDAPLGRLGDDTDDTFYGACARLCRALLERYPEAWIVFMTPMHRQGEACKSMFVNPTDGPVPMRRYVEIIREVCAEYGIPVLDLYATLGIQPNIEAQRALYCPDGLHPNAAGHERIAASLTAFLEGMR